MTTHLAKFSVGDVIYNTLLEYRGVIIDVDSSFTGVHGGTRPPSLTGGPWYHVLVDGTANRTYVAERNLAEDASGGPIDHPDIIDYFEGTRRGSYISRAQNFN